MRSLVVMNRINVIIRPTTSGFNFSCQDKSQFDQYKTYLLYYGYYDAASMTFEEYSQVSPEEYDSIVAENASKQAQLDLTYESIFKNAGLSVSEDDYAQIKEYYGFA